MRQWTREHEKLTQMTLEVDYDVDAYAQNLDELLNIQINCLSTFKDKVMNFKAELSEEELISKKLNR